MAAPEGNQFWKKRAKSGRNRIFKTPKLLIKAAHEYFQWCVENPHYKQELMRSGDMAGEIVQIPIDRPFSIKGMCIFFGTNSGFWSQFKDGIAENKTLTNEEKQDFSSTIKDIEEIIYTQKYEHAVIGTYNASIMGKDLEMVEKIDSTTRATNTNVNYSVELSKEEIRDIDKSLEEEF